ncbi:MAG: FG-GAP-like repeat-containing protein [Polyangia bacterium]
MRALALALALLGLAACSNTRQCKKGTILLEVDYGAGVDKITLDVQHGDTAHSSGVLTVPVGSTSGTAEIDFATYTEGQAITVSLRAYMGSTVVAGKTETIKLTATCTHAVIALDSSAVDGGFDGPIGQDMNPDLSGVPACDTGNHYCGGTVAACVSDVSVTSCGTSCTPCDTPTHGTATCTSGSCGVDCDAGYAPSGTTCDIAPPKNLAPASGVLTPDTAPTFAWTLAAGTNGAHLEICSDRTCTTPVYAQDVAVSTVRLTTALPTGKTLYWHVAGRISGTNGTTYSPFWEFRPMSRSSTDGPYGTFGKNTDINGDGRSDVVVGDDAVYPPAEQRMGDIHVHYGVTSGVAANAGTVVGGGSATGGFAHSVSTLGDVDGDGYADVLVGSEGEGKAYFYKGSAQGLVTTVARTLSSAATSPDLQFATHVAAAGDVNGDGYADALVGGSNSSNGAWVFYGGPTGLPALPSATLTVPTGSTWFGTTLSGAGDINRDGYADILVGDFNAGKVYIYFGSATGIGATASQVLARPSGTGSFGDALCGGADVNSDGYADIVVTSESGKMVWVFQGNQTGVVLAPLNVLTAPAPGTQSFGTVVDLGGDINGDGYPDLFVAARNYATQYVYLGASNGFAAAAHLVTTPANSGASGVFADVNNDGYSDLVIGDPQDPGAQVVYINGSSTITMIYTSTFTDTPVTGRYGVVVQ